MAIKGGKRSAEIAEEDLDAELRRAMADLAQLKEYYSDPCKLAGTPSGSLGTNAHGNGASSSEGPEVTSAGNSSLDRLAVAEAVIRKLYRRNQELESQKHENDHAKAQNQAEEARLKEVEDDLRVMKARNAALEASLRSTEAKLAEKHQQASMLATRLEALGGENRKLVHAQRKLQAERKEDRRRVNRLKDLEEALQQAQQQTTFAQTQMESMRRAQALRVSGSKRDTQNLVSVLTRQLDAQAEQHELERAAFNEKLARLESENCTLYVSSVESENV
ncbi:Hypothetical Protein FCC1311_070242 [Hondaea fermentalgiana]|uniref:Uncharacterized protein n=1 Tax=Hondaea fermentalgiana TaxID=2315210 RepID=A0A2R5GSE9_9STRA|nr:Hypothetical Protein FCC1311_070242 [Hondaea fermentalgiana]|eukprot:GBG30804.1 Hypothetical Protein FCC1311_070242 [Hondaea fermentalgiana]